jgi:hypothetical protein
MLICVNTGIPKYEGKVCLASAIILAMKCVSLASAFQHQGQSDTAGHGLFWHCPVWHIPRVSQCLSPCQNWDPSPPLPQTRVSPPEPNGEGAHSHAVEGVESPNSDNWRKSLVPKFIDPVFVNDWNECFEPVFAKTGSINLGILLCLLCRIKSANCSEPLDMSMLRALVLANH